jgi:hypothetical protein
VIAETLAGDEALLILKIAFLVLLYGFIVMIARSATKDLGGTPQESIVLGAAEAAKLRAELGVRPGVFVVVASPVLRVGSQVEIAGPTTLGRETGSGIRLERDEFASARHARIEPRTDGVWIEDLGSTNGTFVNDVRITGAQRLGADDVVKVGATELRFQA